MRSLLLLLASAIAMAASTAPQPQSPNMARYDVQSASCPAYRNGGNGLKCIGIGLFDGMTINGQRYKCSICGHRWLQGR